MKIIIKVSNPTTSEVIGKFNQIPLRPKGYKHPIKIAGTIKAIEIEIIDDSIGFSIAEKNDWPA